MILVIIGLILATAGLSMGFVFSRRKFKNSITSIADREPLNIDHDHLDDEFCRISKLQDNLVEINRNINNLIIPSPESLCSYDDVDSSLNKITQFFEEHNLATVGTEQFILSLLPTSQIGQSLHAVSELIPQNIGHEIFGDAFASIKDGIMTIPTSEGLAKFIGGMGHLSKLQMRTMLQHFEHHDYAGALLTPLKSGVMELMNAHDAGQQLISSIKEVGADLSSSLECSASVGELADATDIDITGHIPVITIGISSFREFQLLSEDKTDFITSVKNITLDAVGAGAGGALGAKAGALIGTTICPGLGTVIGGMCGAIGGALLGRTATNKIKRLALDNAIKEYETSYNNMKSETREKSRETLNDIEYYCADKRDKFFNSDICTKSPVTDSDATLQTVSLSIYQFVLAEIADLKKSLERIKNSIWYSSKKYDTIVTDLESRLNSMEQTLPPVDLVRSNPQYAIDLLINLEMPNRRYSEKLQDKINQCAKELEGMNDRNDASILAWSYVISQSYQATLNDIADYANGKMKSLNDFFAGWRSTLEGLENKVRSEKDKLGLS